MYLIFVVSVNLTAKVSYDLITSLYDNSRAAFEAGMKNVEAKRKQTIRMAFISTIDT